MVVQLTQWLRRRRRWADAGTAVACLWWAFDVATGGLDGLSLVALVVYLLSEACESIAAAIGRNGV